MNRLDGKTVITIIGVIGLMIFAFIFTIGYILSNIDPENKLEGYTIAISFIGIFATFGGAYLGAKISGENASKIAKNQMIMDDLKTYSINNRNFLKDFDENIDKVLIKKIHNKRELSNALEFQNYKFSVYELNRKVVKCGIKYDDELSHSVFYPFELYRIKLYYLKDYLNNIENKMVKKYEEIIYKEISKEFNQDVDKNHLILKEYDNFNKVFLEPNRDNSVNFVECRIEIIQNEVTILDTIKNEENLTRYINENYDPDYVSFQIGEDENYIYEKEGKYKEETIKLEIEKFDEINRIVNDAQDELTEILAEVKLYYKKMIFKNENDLNEYILGFYEK
ncbi:YrzE family protein [Staphylococcus cohnii]